MANEMYRTRPAEQKKSIWRWLLPALAAVVALLVIVPMFGRKDSAVTSVMNAPAPAPGTAAPGAALPSGTVFFEVDQASLPGAGQAALIPVIEYMKTNPSATAVISGYHDASGDQAANEVIARSRAESVQATLVAAGIDASRIEMQKPGVTEGGGTAEQARRVEVTVRQ